VDQYRSKAVASASLNPGRSASVARRRRPPILRPLLVALGLLAACGTAGAASAQLRFVSDMGYHPVLGPKDAAGIVIWSHGRSLRREDSTAPTPPYIEVLRQQRWDVIRFNRLRAFDDLENGPAALVDAARKFKSKGYRRVILAGQSFGAFISLIAGDDSDDVDAIVATAPAAYPPTGAWIQFNALKLYSLLEHTRRARVMLFYFKGDEFDPGGRGARSEKILTERGIPHLVIDKPAGLLSHWATSTQQFAGDYADCIAAFALDDGARGSLRCSTVEPWDARAHKMAQPPARGASDTPG
jgi:dienelactone hydrolase